MGKILLSPDNEVYDRIKNSAKMEQRSVANYMHVLIKNLFKDDSYVRSDSVMSVAFKNFQIEKSNFEKNDNKILSDNVLTNENVKSKLNDNRMSFDKMLTNKEETIIKNSQNSLKSYDESEFFIRNTDKKDVQVSQDTYEEYTRLEKLGIDIRLKYKNNAAYSWLFAQEITDHMRGWLFENPSCNIKDYHNNFPNMF